VVIGSEWQARPLTAPRRAPRTAHRPPRTARRAPPTARRPPL